MQVSAFAHPSRCRITSRRSEVSACPKRWERQISGSRTGMHKWSSGIQGNPAQIIRSTSISLRAASVVTTMGQTARTSTSASALPAKTASRVLFCEVMPEPNLPTLDEVLKSSPSTVGDLSTAQILDQIIESPPDVQQRIADWNRVAAESEAKGVSSSHAHFRLGILHLVNDPDEATGVCHLERAYEQDQRCAVSKESHRLAAYRVLSLVRDFLAGLSAERTGRVFSLVRSIEES